MTGYAVITETLTNLPYTPDRVYSPVQDFSTP